MRKLIFSLALLLTGASAIGQTCCQLAMSSTSASALLAANPDFQKAHLLPLAFVLQNPAGGTVSFPTTDGKTANAYLVKAAQPSNKYLLLFHEVWGLNDYVKQEADRWAKELNVNVLALDLYDGHVGTDRESAYGYMKTLNENPAHGAAIVQGAINYGGAGATFGTLGWCMGGTWSLQGAIIGGDKVKACVIYYGMPETDPAKLAPLKASVLGIFAKKDKWITPDAVSKFERLMKQEHKQLVEVKSYDADHAFANPSNPAHDKVASEDAHEVAQNFLSKYL